MRTEKEIKEKIKEAENLIKTEREILKESPMQMWVRGIEDLQRFRDVLIWVLESEEKDDESK